jgi:hypothetical protein
LQAVSEMSGSFFQVMQSESVRPEVVTGIKKEYEGSTDQERIVFLKM